MSLVFVELYMTIDFNTDESVVFPTIQGLAVYKNEGGDIVIAQEGINGIDDSFVYIPMLHVAAVIRAINKLAYEKTGGDNNEVV